MPGENQPQNETQDVRQTNVQIDDKQSRLWATFCHLSALALFLGFPFGNILGPLVIWIIKKNDLPEVDKQGKESLNFQISMTIYTAISSLLCFILIGFPLLFGLLVANVILVVIASMKANNGEQFGYPATIRFIK